MIINFRSRVRCMRSSSCSKRHGSRFILRLGEQIIYQFLKIYRFRLVSWFVSREGFHLGLHCRVQLLVLQTGINHCIFRFRDSTPSRPQGDLVPLTSSIFLRDILLVAPTFNPSRSGIFRILGPIPCSFNTFQNLVSHYWSLKVRATTRSRFLTESTFPKESNVT